MLFACFLRIFFASFVLFVVIIKSDCCKKNSKLQTDMLLIMKYQEEK